ncbi:DUF6975 family protein [Pedomonas mirosovicensis]|uniref:DUF6975 family protein n=1 Tax=Pedomonas mirosovicensis TaxID=2908641 RepID=UPI00216714E9|nr:hypothetical protein [Pedomonas mirosovicensis]MCH8685503.1 hypothetical protein [Pedomonas mirosovicensis]
MSGVVDYDVARRQGTSHWNNLAQQNLTGRDFATHLLDGLKREPALSPAYLTELSGNSWEQTTSLLADFAHLFAIASHGWPVMATQVAAGLQHHLPSDLVPSDLAVSLFGDSILHADCIRQLAVAVGPTRLRAGLTTAEANALAHRRRMEILLTSERTGCAFGTGIAISLSWMRVAGIISHVLQTAPSGHPAITVPELEVMANQPPASTSTLAQYLATAAESPSARRGLLFGIGQALALQVTFWSLLADRARTLSRRKA